MNEVWMLDYLNAVIPSFGVFESEEDALAWAEKHDPERSAKGFYKPFKLTVNRELIVYVPHTAPNRRYINQR